MYFIPQNQIFLLDSINRVQRLKSERTIFVYAKTRVCVSVLVVCLYVNIKKNLLRSYDISEIYFFR